MSYNVVDHGGVRGRQKEIATLKKLYKDCSHVSKVLIVEGKAGVGKTALITSPQTAFFQTDGHFVSGTFSEQRQSEPFSAIVDAIHELFEELLTEEFSLDENSVVKEIMDKFAKESKNDAGIKAVLTKSLPKFAEMLQVAKDNKRMEQIPLDISVHSFSAAKKKKKAATPAGVRARPNRSSSGYKKGWNFEKLKVALRLLLRCICSPKRRVVLFLDDLHYADPTSLELVEFLASGDGLSTVSNGTGKDGKSEEDDPTRIQGMMLILAYRNARVDPKKKSGAITIDHPFRARLKELKLLKCPIHRIHVKELELDTVNSMVAIITRNQLETTLPLSEVIHKKTGGNPHAVLEMIEYLEHQGALFFSTDDYTWKWKSVRTINAATDLSDTMVDMVAKKLDNLPKATQQLLMLGSCLGSYFRLEVVAAYFRKYNKEHHKIDFAAAAELAETEEEEIGEEEKKLDISAMHDSMRSCAFEKNIRGSSTLMDQMILLLQQPMRQDLLTRRRKSTTYFFTHERLQSAAYALLPKEEKQRKEIHWRLGKLMKEKSENFEEEHWMAYLATDQLNRGLIFLHDTSEKVELAQMNLQIALMSQEKSAFCPAAEFLRSAICLIFGGNQVVGDPAPKSSPNKPTPSPAPTKLYKCSSAQRAAVWIDHYELCLDLFSCLAEMEYLLGNHKAAKEAVDELLENARSDEDKFRAQIILIESISAQRDFDAAIETCLKILSSAYEMKLSSSPMKLQIMAEKKKVNKMLEQQIQLENSGSSQTTMSDSSSSMFGFNSSLPSMSGRGAPAAITRPKSNKPNVVNRGKSLGSTPLKSKPTVVSRAKSAGLPKNESRGAPSLPKNEGRFQKAGTPSKTGKISRLFGKKQEQALMSLPKMTDDKSIRVSKLLAQLMLNSILSGKTDLSAYIGLRSIRFSFQNGISPHSPMALAAYGISQAKEGKYNDAFANGMLALKLLDISDGKEWYTRTIVKAHNLRHIKRPFHESLDPLMSGYRTGVESGDMEYALVAAMQYSLLYIFVGLPLMPLEPDLMAFAEQVHRYHLPFVLEVTFFIYREFVLDLQGVEYDKISLDEKDDTSFSLDGSLRSSSTGTPHELAIEKRVRPLVQREMCMMKIQKHYMFGDFEEAEKAINELAELPKFDYSIIRTLTRDTFVGLVNLALAKITGKKRYKEKGRKIIDEFESYVKHGSVNSHHILKLLEAEEAAIGASDWISVAKGYDEAIKSAARSGFTNHEAISNERAGRCLTDMTKIVRKLKDDPTVKDNAKRYISRAMALYKEWGAKAKVDQLEEQFPSFQPSTIMQGSNIKARRRFSRTLTAQFRDMKLHSGRWSVGASSDLKVLDGFDELKENGNGNNGRLGGNIKKQRGSVDSVDPYKLGK